VSVLVGCTCGVPGKQQEQQQKQQQRQGQGQKEGQQQGRGRGQGGAGMGSDTKGVVEHVMLFKMPVQLPLEQEQEMSDQLYTLAVPLPPHPVHVPREGLSKVSDCHCLRGSCHCMRGCCHCMRGCCHCMRGCCHCMRGCCHCMRGCCHCMRRSCHCMRGCCHCMRGSCQCMFGACCRGGELCCVPSSIPRVTVLSLYCHCMCPGVGRGTPTAPSSACPLQTTSTPFSPTPPSRNFLTNTSTPSARCPCRAL